MFFLLRFLCGCVSHFAASSTCAPAHCKNLHGLSCRTIANLEMVLNYFLASLSLNKVLIINCRVQCMGLASGLTIACVVMSYTCRIQLANKACIFLHLLLLIPPGLLHTVNSVSCRTIANLKWC